MTVESNAASPLHLGRVTAFDARRGWGTVAERDGTEFGFHATAIADGTRTIALGVEVHFLVAPGHRGRYEARSLTGVGASPA
jgi:cold shock CspA family protein